MQLTGFYITYTTSSREQTGDLITFAQFEWGGLLETLRNIEKD